MTDKKNNLLVSILNFIKTLLSFLSNRKQDRLDEKKKEDKRKIELELKKALAEGRIQDAAYWRKKLNVCLFFLMTLLVFTQGCLLRKNNFFSTQFATSLETEIVNNRIVQRIILVNPKEEVRIEKATAPATKWFLIDDIAAFQAIDAGILITGDRFLIAQDGLITIPSLIFPAQQWYIVDDYGLLKWLGLKY